MELINIKHKQEETKEILTMGVQEDNNIIANVEIERELSYFNEYQEDYLTNKDLNSLETMTNYPYSHIITITSTLSPEQIKKISSLLYTLIGISPSYFQKSEGLYTANVIISHNLILKALETLENKGIKVEEVPIINENKHRI